MFKTIKSNLKINCDWYNEIVDESNSKKLLRILYDIGFIGDYVKGGSGGSKTIYSYKEVHEPLFTDFQIHPCFRKAMSTVDRIRKKK